MLEDSWRFSWYLERFFLFQFSFNVFKDSSRFFQHLQRHFKDSWRFLKIQSASSEILWDPSRYFRYPQRFLRDFFSRFFQHLQRGLKILQDSLRSSSHPQRFFETLPTSSQTFQDSFNVLKDSLRFTRHPPRFFHSWWQDPPPSICNLLPPPSRIFDILNILDIVDILDILGPTNGRLRSPNRFNNLRIIQVNSRGFPRLPLNNPIRTSPLEFTK